MKQHLRVAQTDNLALSKCDKGLQKNVRTHGVLMHIYVSSFFFFGLFCVGHNHFLKSPLVGNLMVSIRRIFGPVPGYLFVAFALNHSATGGSFIVVSIVSSL